MQAVFLILASLLWQSSDLPIVVEDVDTIAVCHILDGGEIVVFFAPIQGDWACLDHRWLSADMAPGRDGDRWTLAWYDDGDSCFRLIRAACWIETWERESPLAIINNRPWFARLCAPGLAQPQQGPQ